MTNECLLVASSEMAQKRSHILHRLGGWPHRRWQGWDDETVSVFFPRRVRNLGLASFVSESGLQSGDEVTSAPPGRSKQRRSAFSRMLYDGRRDNFAGIPDAHLLDHRFDFTLDGIDDWAWVTFPYIEAVAGHIHQLRDLQYFLREYGVVVRCIEHGWWNDKTVGLFYFPIDAGFEYTLAGYQQPLGRDTRGTPHAL